MLSARDIEKIKSLIGCCAGAGPAIRFGAGYPIIAGHQGDVYWDYVNQSTYVFENGEWVLDGYVFEITAGADEGRVGFAEDESGFVSDQVVHGHDLGAFFMTSCQGGEIWFYGNLLPIIGNKQLWVNGVNFGSAWTFSEGENITAISWACEGLPLPFLDSETYTVEIR